MVPRARLSLSTRGALDSPGFPSSTRVQRRDSLDDPLMGFRSSPRHILQTLPACSHTPAPLLGFLPLQRSREMGVHGRPTEAGSTAWAQGPDSTGSSTCQLRRRSRLSQPFSDLLLPKPSCHVSDRWHSWGSPFRGLFLSCSPGQLVTAGKPSWRFSSWLAYSLLEREYRKAHREMPRIPSKCL